MRGMSARSSSVRSRPRRVLSENRPGPISSHPAASRRSSTSGARKRPEPRPRRRIIGNGHPAFRSARAKPRAFSPFSRSRSAPASFVMTCGMSGKPAGGGNGARSASIRSWTRRPGFAGMNGAKAPAKPASRIGSANAVRKARIVTPRRGASQSSGFGPAVTAPPPPRRRPACVRRGRYGARARRSSRWPASRPRASR